MDGNDGRFSDEQDLPEERDDFRPRSQGRVDALQPEAHAGADEEGSRGIDELRPSTPGNWVEQQPQFKAGLHRRLDATRDKLDGGSEILGHLKDPKGVNV